MDDLLNSKFKSRKFSVPELKILCWLHTQMKTQECNQVIEVYNYRTEDNYVYVYGHHSCGNAFQIFITSDIIITLILWPPILKKIWYVHAMGY